MVNETPKTSLENKEQESQSPDISSEQKDLTNLQTNVEATTLRQEVLHPVEAPDNRSYELVKGTKMHEKLLQVLGSEAGVEFFAKSIDTTVGKYIDQELGSFPDEMKKSMNVGIQGAMRKAFVKQGAAGSAEFFNAFSRTKSSSASEAFKGLYASFGKLGAANEFFILANKVQNITRFLADNQHIIKESTIIPELMNPYQFEKLLEKPIWSNQRQLEKADIRTLLTLDGNTSIDIHAGEEELRKIMNDDKISAVITDKTISAIQRSLISADKLLDTRGKFKTKASEFIDKIANILDIDIPFFGNLGELVGMKFPTEALGKKNDGGVMNFVLGVLGFRGGIKGLHREYIQEKLDDLAIDDDFVSSAYKEYIHIADPAITEHSSSSTWTICGLSADEKIKAQIQSKIPEDYDGLKKVIENHLTHARLSPVMVAKFFPGALIGEGKEISVDVSKIPDVGAFADAYLKYIIPVLADPNDSFIMSKNVDANAFVLAVMGGLVGDKYFIEGVNLGIVSSTDFGGKNIKADLSPETSPDVQKNAITQELIRVKSPISADMVISSARTSNIPISYLMAVMKNDSNYGTKGLGAKTHNPGNVGNTDDGSSKDRGTWEAGVDAIAKNLRKRIDAYHAKYLGGTPSIKELISGKKDGEVFFLPYMTAQQGPAIVQSIQQDLERQGISTT